MEVILLQDVEKVGLRGDVVNVSRGYMRNFLQPRRLAEPATPARVAELEKRETIRARHEAKSFEQAQEMAEKVRQAELRVEVKAGPRGRLFGAVTPTNIADALWRAERIRIDRRKIHLADPIKRVGRYEVPIELFQDVDAEVKVVVVPEGGQLPPEEELAAWEAEEAAERAATEAAAAAEQAAAEEAVEEILAEEDAAPAGAAEYGEQAAAAGVGEETEGEAATADTSATAGKAEDAGPADDADPEEAGEAQPAPEAAERADEAEGAADRASS